MKDYGPESRIVSYAIQAWKAGSWVTLARGQMPATSQIHQFPRTVAERVRLNLEGSQKQIGIAEFGVYNEPVVTNASPR